MSTFCLVDAPDVHVEHSSLSAVDQEYHLSRLRSCLFWGYLMEMAATVSEHITLELAGITNFVL